MTAQKERTRCFVVRCLQLDSQRHKIAGQQRGEEVLQPVALVFQVHLLGKGLVQNVSKTIDIYVLDWALDARNTDYSLGTAAGIFKTAVSLTLIVITNTIAKKTGDERLF